MLEQADLLVAHSIDRLGMQADGVDGFRNECIDMGDGGQWRTRVTRSLPLSLVVPFSGQTGYTGAMALDSNAVVFGA